MYQHTKEKINSKKGMTMAEMLVAVAIILILAGVAFIAVMGHQRTLEQLERDAIAKEIFVAAQNHLTAEKGGNYGLGPNYDKLSSEDAADAAVAEPLAGTREKTDEEGNPSTSGTFSGVYYIVVNKGDAFNEGSPVNGSYMIKQMLPFGSIDETVRGGGKYVIRYQPNIGKVLDVFYWSDDPEKFDLVGSFTETVYLEMMESRGEANKNKRRKFPEASGKAVIGWCGGENVEALGFPLEAPEIKVINENTLRVESTDINPRESSGSENGIVIKLMVRGKSTGAERFFKLTATRKTKDDGTIVYEGEQVLDDITDKSLHFAAQFNLNDNNDDYGNGTYFLPGENLELYLEVYSESKLANIAVSSTKVTNSLFASISSKNDAVNGGKKTYQITGDTISLVKPNGTPATDTEDITMDTAYIRFIRHLENLDKSVSNLQVDYNNTGQKGIKRNAGNATTKLEKLEITSAVQREDMCWNDNAKWKETHPNGKPFITDTSLKGRKQITYSGTENSREFTSSTRDNSYKPVTLLNNFSYDGAGFNITGITVDEPAYIVLNNTTFYRNAGLFSTVTSGTISNIELIDFTVNSSGKPDINTNATTDGASNAGALAGKTISATIENITVRDETPRSKVTDAAIKATGNVGGLIGEVSGGKVNYCAAALTVGDKTIAAGTAGGLIGKASGSAAVTGCYSAGHTENGEYYHATGTAAVEPLYNAIAAVEGGYAGGLIGDAGNSSIKCSYSTCSSSAGTAGGFVGNASGTISNCYCTGLVSGELTITKNGTTTTRTNDNAFIGNGNPTLTGNHYYSIVNEVPMRNDKNRVTSIEYKLSGGPTTTDDKGKIIDASGITPFDQTKMGEFSSKSSVAYPYDPFLKSHYSNGNATDDKGLYYLDTVKDLVDKDSSVTDYNAKLFISTHYGDWPAPEVFVINKKTQ